MLLVGGCVCVFVSVCVCVCKHRASLDRSLASLAGGSGVGSSIQSRHDTQRTRPQAVALTMALRDQDPLLRFYDMCPAYAQREEWLETWLVGETHTHTHTHTTQGLHTMHGSAMGV